MSFRDDLGNLCFYEIRLQLYSIAVPRISEFTLLRNAQSVYGQYGIGLRFVNGQSLLLSRQQQVDLNEVNGSCEWSTLSADQQQVHNLRDDYRSSPNEIRIYFVNEIREANGKPLNGCGGHLPGRPAVTVATSSTRWTFAHELGHLLLGAAFRPVHADDRNNLMHAPTSEITGDPPVLTPTQVTAIKASRYCLIPADDIPPFLRPVPRRRSTR